jgi:hypothetical protein
MRYKYSGSGLEEEPGTASSCDEKQGRGNGTRIDKTHSLSIAKEVQENTSAE